MSSNDFYSELEESIKSAKQPKIIEGGQDSYLKIEGKEKLNLCSSHYLGFHQNPRIKESVNKVVDEKGLASGYRTLAGTHTIHIELEEKIAEFKGTEAALTFSSAYLANAAAVQTIIGKEDIVISDELNHASIIDAVRLSQVKNKFIYKHADSTDLEEKIKDAKKIVDEAQTDGKLPRILIITDGVFSMDGDLAPLPEIVRLAKEYEVLVMVDDAHGEGVMGKGGRGVVDHFGLVGEVDIEIGSLSKAFSSVGGFIAGNKTLIEYYKMNSRQRLFSIALSLADAAAALEGIKILLESDEPVKKLWENTDYIKTKFKEMGYDVGNSETPITPVMIGDEEKAKEMSARLYEMDVFATPIIFPMVAKGKARIRVIPSASHTKDDLDKGLVAFEKVGKEMGIL